MKYQIDCGPGHMIESDTILGALSSEGIVKFKMMPDGRIFVTEMCDAFFGGYLTKAQTIALANELRDLANTPFD